MPTLEAQPFPKTHQGWVSDFRKALQSRARSPGQPKSPTPDHWVDDWFDHWFDHWVWLQGFDWLQGKRVGMSDAKVNGIIHLIEETKTFGNKGFRKRLVVLEQDKGSFTNYVPIEFLRDSCDTVDDLNVGDEIEVSYRLNGRRWQRDESSEAKYFLSAEAMSFKLLQSSQDTMTERVSSPNDAFSEAGEDDEPPF